MAETVLHTETLTIGYHPGKKQAKAIAGPLDLSLCAGELICLLGPNGCGKSTLLRTVSGLQLPVSGTVQLGAENLVQMKPAAIARKISLVLTDNVRSGNLDVQSLISLGRYPYSGWLGRLKAEDQAAIDYAVNVTGTAEFLKRKIDSLSDGECQKVMLARAIAQDTPIIILDEPTAHLDLPSRIQLMRLLHQLAKETHKAILISTHELDLALQAADRIWLMDKNGHLSAGLPEELVLNGAFQQAFDKDGILFDAATGAFHLHTSGQKELSFSGEGITAEWTKKALIRKGYTIVPQATMQVSLTGKESGVVWLIQDAGITRSFNSLPDFLHAL